MIKVMPHSVDLGSIINIPNEFINTVSLITYDKFVTNKYRIIDIAYNSYLCEPICDEENNFENIWISSFVAHYLINSNVQDCNVGLYFSDYLPILNSKLILSDSMNNSTIAVQLKLNAGIFQDGIHMSFILEDLLTFQRFSINTLSRYSWKYLNDTDIYMSDMEKMYQDTFIHKAYVIQVCNMYATYLENHGETNLAKQLKKRAIVHDNSKIKNRDEFLALTSIINDKSCLGSTTTELSSIKKACIALHWKNNRHHPEYFNNHEEMSKLDKIEMVCDWMARSLQYKNDLIDFVENKQKQRFNFTENTYAEILEMCKKIVWLYKNTSPLN